MIEGVLEVANKRLDMIAPCGLDCSKCDIYRAKSEPETMQRILDWFKRERNIDLKPEQVACQGCLGDRSAHWSADCDILRCSADKRGLTSCSSCDEFPCVRLESFASHGPKYAAALERLRGMKKGKSVG